MPPSANSGKNSATPTAHPDAASSRPDHPVIIRAWRPPPPLPRASACSECASCSGRRPLPTTATARRRALGGGQVIVVVPLLPIPDGSGDPIRPAFGAGQRVHGASSVRNHPECPVGTPHLPPSPSTRPQERQQQARGCTLRSCDGVSKVREQGPDVGPEGSHPAYDRQRDERNQERVSIRSWPSSSRTKRWIRFFILPFRQDQGSQLEASGRRDRVARVGEQRLDVAPERRQDTNDRQRDEHNQERVSRLSPDHPLHE